jgi:phosphate uptake regulator
MTEDECDMSRLQFMHHHEVADQLERVADHAVKISEATLAMNVPAEKNVSKEIANRSKDSSQILQEAVSAFIARDTDLANQVLELREQQSKFFSEAHSIAAEKQPAEASAISIALDSLLRIAEYGFNIAENALDAPVTRQV